MHLKTWLNSERGRATSLAAHLGVSVGRISQMAEEGVPTKYMLRVRSFTKGRVTLESMVEAKTREAITAATWINKLMIKALARIPSMGMGTPMFLASRTVKEMLSIGALDKSQNALSFTEAVNQYGNVAAGSVAGQGTGIQGGQLKFMGVPVLTVDQILATEARVV